MNIRRKPEWLRKKVNPGEQADMRNLLGELRLNTVCQQALCPNISECFSCGQATFLILGTRCTRQCSFCNVDKALPEAVDSGESGRVAQAVSRLNLAHVVITSPTRDDLEDGGASWYAETVRAIRGVAPCCRVELLIPDFAGSCESLEVVAASRPDIIAHNVETVPRLYAVRSGADFDRSLRVLSELRRLAPDIPTKSGIMLGMGEAAEEVRGVLRDLRKAGCSYLSIGQYLAPGRRHFPVQEFIPPHIFEQWRLEAMQLGFSHVESGPYVRSSYHAGKYQQNITSPSTG